MRAAFGLVASKNWAKGLYHVMVIDPEFGQEDTAAVRPTRKAALHFAKSLETMGYSGVRVVKK